jgi:hypothetical protein
MALFFPFATSPLLSPSKKGGCHVQVDYTSRVATSLLFREVGATLDRDLSLASKLVPTFADRGVSHGHRGGSLWP